MDGENRVDEVAAPGLFGWVPRVARGRGRPVHAVTDRNRNKVKLLLAFDRSARQIANALGITEPTLRKHYFSELKVRDMARDALEAEMIMSLWDQAEAGNVGAVKQLQAKLDRVDMAKRARMAAGDEDGDDLDVKAKARAVPKGKKQQARDAAADLLSSNPLLNPLRVN